MKVAVLGAGPVGLVAAHTAEAVFGADVKIHGVKVPSNIVGAQYIHEPIDDLTSSDPDGVVEYIKSGTKEGYALKVYGDVNADCSWDKYEGEVPAWDVNRHYYGLFERFEGQMVDTEIRAPYIVELLEEYDVVLSSIHPLGYCLDEEGHEFHWQQVKIVEGMAVPLPHDNLIYYSGDPEEPCYRVSSLFGSQSTEYPDKARRPGKERAITVRKPLSTTCTCFQGVGFENFHRIGRFGEFKKELLITDAYDRVLDVLDEM